MFWCNLALEGYDLISTVVFILCFVCVCVAVSLQLTAARGQLQGGDNKKKPSVTAHAQSAGALERKRIEVARAAQEAWRRSSGEPMADEPREMHEKSTAFTTNTATSTRIEAHNKVASAAAAAAAGDRKHTLAENRSSSFGTFNIGRSNGDGRLRSNSLSRDNSRNRGSSLSRFTRNQPSVNNNHNHNYLSLFLSGDVDGESPRSPSTSQPRLPLYAATHDSAAYSGTHLFSSQEGDTANSNVNATTTAAENVFEDERAAAQSRRSPSQSPPSRSSSRSPSWSPLPPFAFPYPYVPSATIAQSLDRSTSIGLASPPSQPPPPPSSARPEKSRSVRESSLPRYLDHLNHNARAPTSAPGSASQPLSTSTNQRLPERRLVTPLSLHERLAADARARKFQSRKPPGFIWDFPGDEIAPMLPVVSQLHVFVPLYLFSFFPCNFCRKYMHSGFHLAFLLLVRTKLRVCFCNCLSTYIYIGAFLLVSRRHFLFSPGAAHWRRLFGAPSSPSRTGTAHVPCPCTRLKYRGANQGLKSLKQMEGLSSMSIHLPRHLSIFVLITINHESF